MIIERDDGLIAVESANYFMELPGWPETDRWILEQVHGSVLDVGAGAGPASLVLQERGFDVVALDVSPGAVEVCRRRGVDQTVVASIDEAGDLGRGFDTVLMLGNNLGLFGSPDRARQILAALDAVCPAGAIIAGTCLDPYATDNADHLRYHDRNRKNGKMAGEVFVRIRYRVLATDWLPLLWLSLDELSALVDTTSWRIADALPGPLYAVILERR